MSDVETKPECDVKKPDNEEVKAESAETTATDTAPQEPPVEVKESDSKSTMLDVLKKFATGANWADMMLADAAEEENKKTEMRRAAIEKEIADFKKPYIVYISNLSQCVTAEEIYYHFGGKDSVSDVYRYKEGSSGEALVEFFQHKNLFDALMLDGAELLKSKLKVEYVDAVHNSCRTIPSSRDSQPPSHHHTQHQQYNRGQQQHFQPNNAKKSYNRGSGFSKQHYDSRQNTRQPPRSIQSNDVRSTQKGSSQQGIPSLFDSHQKFPEQLHKSSFEPKSQAPVDAAPKPPQPKVEKPSPFGEAKYNDKVGQKLMETEAKLIEEKKTQKKISISSQATVDEPLVNEEQKPEPIPESKSTESAESEKKPYGNVSVVTNSKRKLYPQSHQGLPPNQKIDHRVITKFLAPNSRQAPHTRDNKGKPQKVSETDSQQTRTLYDRRNKKNFDRKDSTNSTTSYSKNRVSKQVSTDEKKFEEKKPEEKKLEEKKPLPAPIVVPEPPPVVPSSENTAVSTPTTNEPATPTAVTNNSEGTPSSAKAKKAKNKNKKKDQKGPASGGKFGVLDEMRD